MPKAADYLTPDNDADELDDDARAGEGAPAVPRLSHWLDVVDALSQANMTVAGVQMLVRRLSATPPADAGLRLISTRLYRLNTDLLQVGEVDIADACRAHEVNWAGLSGWAIWFGQIQNAAEVADGIARLLRQLGQATNDVGLRLLGDELAGVRLQLDVLARRLNVTCVPGARVPA